VQHTVGIELHVFQDVCVDCNTDGPRLQVVVTFPNMRRKLEFRYTYCPVYMCTVYKGVQLKLKLQHAGM
jgi:hypothetical protein